MKHVLFSIVHTGCIVLLLLCFNPRGLDAQQPAPPVQGVRNEVQSPKFTITNKSNLPGMDYRSFEIREGGHCWECEQACLNDPACKAFTLVKPGVQGPNAVCWLKKDVPRALPDGNCISGVKKTPGLQSLTLATPVLNNLQFDWPPGGAKIRPDFNLPGGDYRSFHIQESEAPLPFVCQTACQADPRCLGWTYVAPGVQGTKAECWLKDKVNQGSPGTGVFSGVRLFATLKTPPVKIQKATPELLQQNSALLREKWKSGIEKTVGDLNQQLLANQQQVQIRHSMLMNKYALQLNQWAALPEPLPNPSCLIDYTATEPVVVWQDKSGNKFNTPPAGMAMRQPEVSRVESLVLDESWQENKTAVYDGHYVIVYGKNFGECPDGNCGIRIKYQYLPAETAELAGKKPVYAERDLIPYKDDWAICWTDNFIIARIPVLLPRQVSTDYPNAYPTAQPGSSTLQIWKGGAQSFVVLKEVAFQNAKPGVKYLQMNPTYPEGHITPEAEVHVYGSGFGYKQGNGEIYLEVPSISSTKIIPDITEWSANLIKIKIRPLASELDDIYEGKLFVIDQNGKTTWTWIKFGPRMISTLISGADYFDIHISESEDGFKEEAYTDKQGNFLLVSHFPGCGTWDWSGEQGQDVFFGEKHPLHPKVHLQFFYFREIDPSQDEKNWDFLKDELGPAIANPYFYGLKWGVVAIASWFVSGIGDYGTKIVKHPDWNNPETRIFYNNTCWFDYSGVPNRYMVSFSLRGPEYLTPGSPFMKPN